MTLLFALFANSRPSRVNGIFSWLQRLSAAGVAFNHGQNDAQKTMGMITLALVAFHVMPGGKDVRIPSWVIFSCATAMGLGTLSGGWRIIKTLGTRIIELQPINGFAAETAASIVLATASAFGMPVSTTHIVCGSIFGGGRRQAAQRGALVYGPAHGGRVGDDPARRGSGRRPELFSDPGGRRPSRAAGGGAAVGEKRTHR